jgi:hypothetical protein
MRKDTLRLALVLAITLAPSGAVAQVTVEQTIRVAPEGGPVRLPDLMGGPQRQFKTGTGRIRGRVVASDSGGPIRRAQVRISGSEIAPKAALTDAEGRFDFRDLPAGRFTLQSSKSGFVSVQYGQMRPFEQGRPIELADKQSLDNADINMPRGSVIAGRIVDEFGDPLPDVSVTAMRQSWTNGRRRMVPSPGRIAQTNDLGQFRIYGLPPGDYYVSASMRGATGLGLAEMEVTMVAGAIASGAFGPNVSEPKSGYASTFYPGTANAAEAQRIALGSGQETSGTDFALVPVRLAKITGFVVGADGRPLEGAAVSLVAPSRDLAGLLGGTTGRSGRDGSFTLNSVAPGDYVLQARSVQVFTSAQGDNVMMFRATSMAGGESESGSTPLSVSGEDITNVMVVTNKGGTATGHVTFEGQKPPAASGIRIVSTAVDADGPTLGGGLGTVKEDGSFELKGLAGVRLIRVTNTPPGWILKSVKLNGSDITDNGADFKTGETTSGLEIELTSKATSVSGTVSSSDGSLLKDYTIVVFSENAEQWRLPSTRWVTGSRPDQDGRFKIANLPAGQYYAIAVDYVPQGEWGDPELLDRLKSKGTRFTLDDGATQTLSLKLVESY